jgi:hypothetical protein
MQDGARRRAGNAPEARGSARPAAAAGQGSEGVGMPHRGVPVGLREDGEWCRAAAASSEACSIRRVARVACAVRGAACKPPGSLCAGKHARRVPGSVSRAHAMWDVYGGLQSMRLSTRNMRRVHTALADTMTETQTGTYDLDRV